MVKKRFRFARNTIKNRIRKGKPVWMWKWTADAKHVHKQKMKDGKYEQE